jgi:hypothetical protein
MTQQTDAAEAFGNGMTIDVDGRSFTLMPVGPSELADFESWAKSRLLSIALASLGPGAVASERANLISRMLSTSNQAVSQEMDSYAGKLWWIGASLRKANPETSDADVRFLIDNFGLKETEAMIDRLAGFSDEQITELDVRKKIGEFGIEQTAALIEKMKSEAKNPPA